MLDNFSAHHAAARLQCLHDVCNDASHCSHSTWCTQARRVFCYRSNSAPKVLGNHQVAYRHAQLGMMLSQIDLLPSEQAVQIVESSIRQHNSSVNIIHTTRCTMDISSILNQGAFLGSSQPPSLQSVNQVLDLNNSNQHHQAPTVNAQEATPADADNSSAGPSSSTHQHAGAQHAHGAEKMHSHSHDHEHHSHQHDSSVRSISIVSQGQIDVLR